MPVTFLAVLLAAVASAWTPTSPLPEGYTGHALVYAEGRLYNIGGLGSLTGVGAADRVYVADVAGGAAGEWRAARPLPQAVFFHAAVASQGAIYVLGGYHYSEAGLVVSDAVLYAAIAADGSLGEWRRAPNLPEPVFFTSAASWNGTIFVTGGWNGQALSSNVFALSVAPDGAPGAWRAERSLPEGIYTHAAVSNGTLYVLGGVVNGGTEVQSAVLFSTIDGQGALGAWTPTAALPQPLSNHGASVANGRVFVTGGWTGTQPTADAVSALVADDRSLSGWTAIEPLPVPVYLHAQTVSPTHLFTTGGTDGHFPRTEVHSMPLPASPEPDRPADELAPRTLLSVGEPRWSHGATVFISPATPLALSAVDDARVVGDGAGVGVAETLAAVDDAALAPYSAPVRVPNEGSRWLRYLSVDGLGRREAERSAALAVDATAPQAGLDVGAPRATLADGRLVVAPTTPLRAWGSDPVSAGVASGVERVQADIDGAAVADPAQAFTLAAGDAARVVSVRAFDRVGNAGAASQTTLRVDAAAPLSSASPAGGWLGAEARVTISAHDALAGVARTELSIDGEPASDYDGAFGLDEGSRQIAYRSLDFVGNAETWKNTFFMVDLTAPQTTLALGSGTSLLGQDIASDAASLSLSAADPVSSGVSAGVERVVYSVDGGPEQVYEAPFMLGEGGHEVVFGAVDRAGNAEDPRTARVTIGSFLSDAVAAVESLELSGNALVAGDARAPSISAKPGSISGARLTEAPAAALDLAAAKAYAKGVRDLGSVTLASNQTLTLAAGDYYASALTLAGQAALKTSGRVNLFVGGPVSVSGGATLNETGDAAEFWVVSDGEAFELLGNARAALNVYAPRAKVLISGKGEFAGRLLGREVKIAGKGCVPSDTALSAPRHEPGSPKRREKAFADSGAGNTDFSVASWIDSHEEPQPREAAGPQAAVKAAPARRASDGAAVRKAHAMPRMTLGGKTGFSIVTDKGGSARGGERGGVTIPEGAAPSGLAVTVRAAATPDAAKDSFERRALSAAGASVEFGPHGTRFAQAVTIELPFDSYRSDLLAYYWNDARGEWEALPSVVDRQAKVVRAQTNHFSLYQVLAPAGAAAGSGEASFGEVFAFPNPARPGQTPTLRVNAQNVDGVHLKVYDASGELKFQSEISQARAQYDFPVTGLGSGVYVYSVTGGGLQRRGRLAVIR